MNKSELDPENKSLTFDNKNGTIDENSSFLPFDDIKSKTSYDQLNLDDKSEQHKIVNVAMLAIADESEKSRDEECAPDIGVEASTSKNSSSITSNVLPSSSTVKKSKIPTATTTTENVSSKLSKNIESGLTYGQFSIDEDTSLGSKMARTILLAFTYIVT